MSLQNPQKLFKKPAVWPTLQNYVHNLRQIRDITCSLFMFPAPRRVNYMNNFFLDVSKKDALKNE